MWLSRTLLGAAALGCVFASTVPAASPFAGKWKFNPSKSAITGLTDSVAAAGPNAWKFTYGSYSWTVKADGSDQATPFGNTVALKAVSPAKWQLTNKINGKVTSTDTWVLADDGQSMTRTSAGTHENGQAFTDVTKMKRTGGAKGFEGTWESAEYKGAPSEVDIEDAGTGGIVLTVPADGIKLALKFDGKDYPAEGPRVAPGSTTAAKLTSPRKIEATSKVKDKVLDKETWEVSADGKTFTYTEQDAGESKAIVAIYDRI